MNLSNRLNRESSPYLLQHAENPVNWYPWCEEAFQRAKEEDKPIFLSIGYSTCHWCHVMAHESFEDEEIAELLNRYFISIKVDKEERPDIDSIYMAVCQAFTGSGGWPTSIFMTAEQKPFFAGTYFPPDGRGGMMGMKELLSVIREQWETDRSVLLQQAEDVILHLNHREHKPTSAASELVETAVEIFERTYDPKHGGFGRAPKFPTPHNLLFLLNYYERYGNKTCLRMAEHTLQQMYRGGLFDHVGFGFCRYSTDKRFLVPHFEKMLYDNALLILAYTKAHACTQNPLYLTVAEKTADYILREMTAPEGGFYSAKDADSDGEEGKYYLFTPEEIIDLLGAENGEKFNRHFGITRGGNFDGKNIPNLLNSDANDRSFEPFLPRIENYRRKRYSLHLDDKILTSWNGLMIAAMCELYRISREKKYLTAAKNAHRFLQEHLWDGDQLYVSYRNGKRGVAGFLDDYAAGIFATLSLYGATLESDCLEQAKRLCKSALSRFEDPTDSGFYLYAKDSEGLILRPKETYDGAIPSGNSLMAYNLVRLWQFTNDQQDHARAERQLEFLAAEAAQYPAGFSMYLSALLEYQEPSLKVTVVGATPFQKETLPFLLPTNATILLLPHPTPEYPLKNGKTTFYVCRNRSCLPAGNNLEELLSKKG